MNMVDIPESLSLLQKEMGASVAMPFKWNEETPEDFILQLNKYAFKFIEKYLRTRQYLCRRKAWNL